MVASIPAAAVAMAAPAAAAARGVPSWERACLKALGRSALALAACVIATALYGRGARGAARLALGRRGRAHRAAGAAYAAWLALGCVTASAPVGRVRRAAYDVVLGAIGVALTLSARAFGHARVRNATASGALDKESTVTDGEIVEHAFYQGLNLVQVLLIHACGHPSAGLRTRVAIAATATAPWLLRARFPVNSFSANYDARRRSEKAFNPWRVENMLYRAKKYQYLLYKHALLHGLNATLAATGADLGDGVRFRAYWLCLNASYVFEFFLQTLVKREHLSQRGMLLFNQWLMLMSTYAAGVVVLTHVCLPLVPLSLAMNLLHRGSARELANFAVVVAAACLLLEGR